MVIASLFTFLPNSSVHLKPTALNSETLVPDHSLPAMKLCSRSLWMAVSKHPVNVPILALEFSQSWQDIHFEN